MPRQLLWTGMAYDSLTSKAVVGLGATGWIVAWHSNQLVQRLPQWPYLRVTPGQEVMVRIDPRGGAFGMRCDSHPDRVQVSAIIEPDEQPAGKHRILLLPFPPFKVGSL